MIYADSEAVDTGNSHTNLPSIEFKDGYQQLTIADVEKYGIRELNVEHVETSLGVVDVCEFGLTQQNLYLERSGYGRLGTVTAN